MAVNIHISGDSAGEALKELTAFAAGLGGGVTAVSGTATTEAEAPAKREKKPKEDKKPEKQEAPPETENTEEPPAEEDESAGEPISAEELRDQIKDITAADPSKKTQVKALLDKYGVKNVSSVPEAKRAAFKADLEAL